MWTGGKPPRIPAVTPEKGGNNNKINSNNVSLKNGKVDAELAALKQRGLAKILNKHFTETASKLAVEKAAADAACRDLEERKARTSEFKECRETGELSPLDQACVKANHWRAECRRKERETLLLYQRYVHKFGDTPGVVLSLSQQQQQTVDTPKTSAPPPSRKPPLIPAKNSTLVPSMAAQIETTLEEYLKQGGLQHPSVMTHGTEETFQSAAAKEEAAFRDFYRRQLEQRGVDAVCGPGYYKASEHGDVVIDGVVVGEEVDVFTRTGWMDRIDAAVAAGEASALDLDPTLGGAAAGDTADDDMCSVVSGLTTLHSAMTREVLQDCERSVQTFLREEQAHIRQIMIAEEGDDALYSITSRDADDHTATVVQDAAATAKEAESMVQQMQDILQDYQSKHNAAKDPAATKSRDARPYPTSNEEEDWMVYYDEFYQQEYYHEKNSNRTQWEPPDRDASFSNSSATDVFSVMNNNGGVDGDNDYGERSHSGMVSDGSAAGGRVAAYRRRRRKQRRRRRTAMLLVAAFAVSLAAVYWQCQVVQPEQCVAVKELVMEQYVAVHEKVSVQFVAVQEQAMVQWKAMTGQTVVDEEVARSLLEEQQLLLQLEQQKAAEEDARRLEAEEEARLAAEEEERQRKALLYRPWACNLPFSYLFHSRCRRLAYQNPVFDLQGLISSMLQ